MFITYPLFNMLSGYRYHIFLRRYYPDLCILFFYWSFCFYDYIWVILYFILSICLKNTSSYGTYCKILHLWKFIIYYSFSEWFFFRMILFQNDSFSEWFFFRMILFQNDSFSEWFFFRMKFAPSIKKHILN